MKKCIICLLVFLFVTSLFAQKIADLPNIKDPDSMVIDNNELLFIDDFSVFVYSLEPLKLKVKFGRKGEGTGEFKYRPIMNVFPDFITAMDFTKTIWFTREGKFIKEKQYTDFEGFNTNMEMQLIPIKENYIRIIVDHDLNKKYVYLLNSDFQQIKKLYEGLFDWNKVGPDVENFRVLIYRIDVWTYDDKIFISDSQRGFFIDVFDYKGNHLYSINKDDEIKKLKVNEDFKKKAMDYIKTNRKWVYDNVKKSAFTFYEYFPPINYYQISDNRIYVTTYKEIEKKHEIIVLDLKGNIIKRLFLPLKSIKYSDNVFGLELYTIKNGKLYELIKNKESGVWELHATDINQTANISGP